MRTQSQRRASLKVFTGIVVTLLALGLSLVGNQGTVFASGSPPDHVHPAPSGGVDTLHGVHPGLAHGVKRQVTQKRGPNGTMTTSSNLFENDPVIMVHGTWGSSGGSGPIKCDNGNFGNPRSYLQAANGHLGLGGDTIYWNGPILLIGYYNDDSNCSYYISTTDSRNTAKASACNGTPTMDGGSVSNSDPTVGTPNEPIEHISCELSWFLYNHFAFNGQNVKMLGYSMGGLVIRYMLERIASGDSHFAPYVYSSDIVTFSTPHSGITPSQQIAQYNNCNHCYEATEMGSGMPLMTDMKNHDHPSANFGTDWTLIGSLGPDFLDWDYQASYMSNSGGLSNNHRIGYDYPIPCAQSSIWAYSNGYDHGDYVNDQCDDYDAPYYYCDGCSRDKTTGFSHAVGAPHSLHEMLLAYVYTNW